MTIQQQIEQEIRRHLQRQSARVKDAGIVETEKLTQVFNAEFLTGASQVLRWLIMNDGGKLTPQIIERALLAVGKEIGLSVG